MSKITARRAFELCRTAGITTDAPVTSAEWRPFEELAEELNSEVRGTAIEMLTSEDGLSLRAVVEETDA